MDMEKINGVILKGLVLKDDMEKKVAEKDPVIVEAKKEGREYIKLYLGGDELINAKNRYCLWLEDSIREDRTKSKFLKVRITEVEKYRKTIKTPVRSSPWLFASNRQSDENYLAVPRIFSGNREYFTAQQEIKDVIVSEDLFTIKDPEGFAFSVIESSMFMA